MKFGPPMIVTLAIAMAARAIAAPVPDATDVKRALPFWGNFSAAALSADWTNQLAKDNRVMVIDGALEFHARANTHAHVERGLNVDSVRVSCALKAENSATPVSLFLSWGASDFIQFGLNSPVTGRLNAREVLGTYPHDYDLGPVAAGAWRFIAVELAGDCIRYLAGQDGKSFECVHVSPRPERFAGAPKLLVLGQDSDGSIFPRPTPWLVAPGTEPVGLSYVRDLRLEALGKRQQTASAEERRLLAQRERDLFGEQELASNDDPSFESVSRHLPAMKWPRETIGVKDNPFAIGVAADGSLQFSADIANYKKPVAFFQIGGYRFGSGATACSKRLLNGYMPIVVANDQQGGLEFEQTVFGHSKDFSPDEPLSAYVRFRATNPGDTARSIGLSLKVEPASDKLRCLAWHLNVPAHGSRAVEVRLPCQVLESPAEEVSTDEFEGKLVQTTAYWNQLIARGSRFEIPEPRVQDAYRAWIAYSFLNVSKRGDVYHVCDGSGFYSKIYGYSAALYCNNLDLLGYHDLAATYFDSLLTFMQTNGLLAVNFGDTDTGAALWSMSEHYRITRDAAWLRRMAPKMLAMGNWIIERRHAALAQTNEPALTRGLIRYRPYADLLHPAADYFSNGYLWKGLAAAAGVFAEIGLQDEAARLKRESDAYRNDISASMEAALFADHGMKILPAIPDTRELWKESDGSANGYYGIIAPCMLEAGLPAWDDPKAALLVNALERRGGLTAGVCQFHDMVDHAYTYGYWMNCLQRDQVKQTILGLYASMAYGMSRGTYAAVECTAARTGENYWTLPHTYSNTQQLRLLRNMLLREEGDKLWIGQAIPREWLTVGKRVAVTDAPSLFGPVSVSLSARADGSMRVHLEPPGRAAPKEIVIRLRHPQRRRIAKVQADRPAQLGFSGDDIRLKEAGGPISLDVTFR